MVSGSKSATKGPKSAGTVKEKIFHPNSRKAGQLERASLRKNKLASASSKRSKVQIEKADRFGFWFHALPPDTKALTLAELHELVTNDWLPRHDEGILSEQSSRRKGRPSSKREIELKALKIKEEQDYRAGLELPDLTHERTVELFRDWNGDPAYLHLLQFIRVSSADPSVAPVIRHGLQERTAIAKSKVDAKTQQSDADQMDMDEDAAPDLLPALPAEA